jgi:lipopolysaccharide export system protein LptA
LIWALLLGCGSTEAAAPRGEVAFEAQGVELIDEGTPIAQAASVRLTDDGQGVAAAPRVQLADPSGPPLTIEAPRSTWSLREGSARFEGGVDLRRAEAHLRCEALDLRFGPGMVFQSATASGGVTLRQPGRLVRADRATLYAPEGRIELVGEPILEEGGNSLTGARITLWLDAERVDCEACRLVLDARSLPQ